MLKGEYIMKKISLILILVLLVSLLAACEGGDDVKKGKTRDGGKNTPTVEPTEQPTEEPTGVPTETPTPQLTAEPTLTPFPLPEQIPTSIDISYAGVSGPENRALLAFAKFLDEKYASYAGNQVDLRFGLFFLNGDQIPELWWAEGGSHAEGVNIALYAPLDKVVDLGTYGEFATCYYYERLNLLVSNYAGMGAEVVSVDRLDWDKMIHTFTFQRNQYDTPDGTVVNCMIDDQPCLEADYESRVSAWMNSESPNFKKIDYGEGLTMIGADGYPVETSYTALFDSYVAMFAGMPFEYGIPDDIREVIVGKWKLESGEVEGWEWQAEDGVNESYWIVEPNGEAELTKVAPNQSVEMYRMDFHPYYPIMKTDYPWCFCAEDKEHHGAYYFLTMMADGRLMQYFYYPDEYIASVSYFKKIN